MSPIQEMGSGNGGNHLNLGRRQRSAAPAFTLVELLVVIGIIAVLVGVLLPALNKARQQANLVVCQTHMRQIGQAIMLYVGDNQGSLPEGYTDGALTAFGGANGNQAADWTTLLVNEMNGSHGNTYTSQGTGASGFNRGVFLDTDVLQAGDGPLAYSCHPRLMPSLNDRDMYRNPNGPPTVGLTPYKLAQVKRGSEIILIMDGVLVGINQGQSPPDNNYWGAEATAFAIDDWRLYMKPLGEPGYTLEQNPTYLLFDQCTTNASPIDAGTNQDFPQGTGMASPLVPTQIGMPRFRHLNNTAGNFLFCDGHVESRNYKSRYVNDILRREINVNINP